MDCKGDGPGKRIEAAEELSQNIKLKCNANNKGCGILKDSGILKDEVSEQCDKGNSCKK